MITLYKQVIFIYASGCNIPLLGIASFPMQENNIIYIFNFYLFIYNLLYTTTTLNVVRIVTDCVVQWADIWLITYFFQTTQSIQIECDMSKLAKFEQVPINERIHPYVLHHSLLLLIKTISLQLFPQIQKNIMNIEKIKYTFQTC